jgi:hypothetical protein
MSQIGVNRLEIPNILIAIEVHVNWIFETTANRPIATKAIVNGTGTLTLLVFA